MAIQMIFYQISQNANCPAHKIYGNGMLQVSEQLSIFDFLLPKLVQSCQDWVTPNQAESFSRKFVSHNEVQISILQEL